MDPERAGQLLGDEHSRLDHLREDLSNELNGQTETDSVSELTEVDQHAADLGSETFEREKDFSMLQLIESQLDDVDRALRRLEDGTYGRCEVCGAIIPDDRLEAVPATRFCRIHEVQAEGMAPLE
ncbi:MAG: General stress protein 16O [Acidimicrobiales bacterium]|nr:MAG: hypothetical protein EDR02_00405 [Actinomycetota bacterium]MBV6506989.1 General stress protein 16O [Acidimicrobiales bacterium]RIK05801.1 MAG: hypothetical protein DCC48_09030 [Acidobacteriota bacterium]